MALTQISTAGVKDDAVTSGKIPANAVGSSELADNAVTNTKIGSNAITNAKMANDSVSTNEIVNSSININKLAGDSVGTTQIVNDAVNGTKIADDSIDSEHYVDGSIDTAHIADQAEDLTKLQQGTSSNDAKFLRANNGADPTFETVSGTTINSNSDNKVITGSNTANTLEAESNLIFNGSQLLVNTGTTSPFSSRKLTVSDVSAGGTTAIEIRSATDGSGRLYFTDSTSSGNAGSYAGKVFYDHTDDHMGIFTGGSTSTPSEKLKVQANGNVDVITGDLSINGSGKGIDFAHGASTGTAANILDDYEEGTYDGTLSVTSGTLVMDTSHNQLSYTRIGRQCTITGRVQVSSVSGLSGYMTMNLPFSVGTSSEYDHGGAGSIFMYNAGGVSNPVLGRWVVWTDGGLSQIYFTYGDSTTAVNGAKVSAGTEVRVTFTYLTS